MEQNTYTTMDRVPNPVLQQTKYEGDIQATIPKRHPLYDALEPGAPVQFQPEMYDTEDGWMFGFTVVFGDEVDMSLSQSRRTKHVKSTGQKILVWPRKLARGTGLAEHTNNGEITLYISETSDGTVTIRFSPSLSIPHLEEEKPPDGLGESIERSLQAKYGEGHHDNKRLEKYRLQFPVVYNDIYNLTEESNVGISVAELDRTLVMVLRPNVNGRMASVIQPLQHEQSTTETSAGNISKSDQFGIYIPKVLAQTLLADTETIQLHPRTSSIILDE